MAGNKVYAGGSFTRARPAGAAAGTNETVRNNFLAFDITTGNLDTGFAPNLNGQVLDVAVTPDKSRVYVVGDFTTADGQARRRVAAYSTSTGQLIASFNPVGVNSRARAVTATNDTVYVGGGFAGQATPRAPTLRHSGHPTGRFSRGTRPLRGPSGPSRSARTVPTCSRPASSPRSTGSPPTGSPRSTPRAVPSTPAGRPSSATVATTRPSAT
ncbi:hypothetical protein [Tessaracoccus coleopterorum]|uniref:hypothetical protein n=1 Tax=Tessaracoccus coleopterorum TaxID=2714950 RepID=UPI001E389CC3|nr:hypothetical protein [Tessaracoccus coleopterorum]